MKWQNCEQHVVKEYGDNLDEIVNWKKMINYKFNLLLETSLKVLRNYITSIDLWKKIVLERCFNKIHGALNEDIYWVYEKGGRIFSS